MLRPSVQVEQRTQRPTCHVHSRAPDTTRLFMGGIPIGFISVPLQIVPWLSFSVPGVSHLLLLSGLVACSLACLVTAVISDPGRCVFDIVRRLECQGTS